MHLSKIGDVAGVGDVVLFKCNTTLSQLQRKVTRSEWDHVGVVVRPDPSNVLYLLEATGEGVSMYPLEVRLRSYSFEFAKYMALRKLRTHLTDEQSAVATAFANRVSAGAGEWGGGEAERDMAPPHPPSPPPHPTRTTAHRTS